MNVLVIDALLYMRILIPMKYFPNAARFSENSDSISVNKIGVFSRPREFFGLFSKNVVQNQYHNFRISIGQNFHDVLFGDPISKGK